MAGSSPMRSRDTVTNRFTITETVTVKNIGLSVLRVEHYLMR